MRYTFPPDFYAVIPKNLKFNIACYWSKVIKSVNVFLSFSAKSICIIDTSINLSLSV